MRAIPNDQLPELEVLQLVLEAGGGAGGGAVGAGGGAVAAGGAPPAPSSSFPLASV